MLRSVAAIAALAYQARLFIRAPHALRWRLETFGLYMPSLPETRPWWRFNLTALRSLIRQLPGYARWAGEMRLLQRRSHKSRRDAAVEAWNRWLEASYPGDE